MGKSWRRERTDHGQRNREQRRGQEQRVPLDLSSLTDDDQDLDYSDSPVYPEKQEQEHA